MTRIFLSVVCANLETLANKLGFPFYIMKIDNSLSIFFVYVFNWIAGGTLNSK